VSRTFAELQPRLLGPYKFKSKNSWLGKLRVLLLLNPATLNFLRDHKNLRTSAAWFQGLWRWTQEKPLSNKVMPDEIAQKIGRGGAGNFYTKADVENALNMV